MELCGEADVDTRSGSFLTCKELLEILKPQEDARRVAKKQSFLQQKDVDDRRIIRERTKAARAVERE